MQVGIIASWKAYMVNSHAIVLSMPLKLYYINGNFNLAYICIGLAFIPILIYNYTLEKRMQYRLHY